ncbi:MAG: T9SS type A sorting domain-containing protein [Bacteroidales bacterium]|nr:T9SS type A sorting domain-containing protein [Bacteroidales bacterium]
MIRAEKVLAIALVLVLSGFQAVSQTIWTQPELPTAEQEMTVYFDATGTPLEDHDGDIYTHTGVNLESADWQYVIGEWGDNDAQPQLQSLGENEYKLEISPDIYSFYGAPETETVTGLAFVFRSADGEIQTGDLFVDVYESGLNVSFVQPENPPLVLENETIDVELQANQSDSVLLEINDEIVKRVAGQSLTYAFEASGENGKNWMRAIAKDADNEVYDSTYFMIRPEVAEEPIPQGMNKGVNYVSDTKVTLVFQAPMKNFVYVLGDFNNWELNNDYYMKKAPDGEHFWLNIQGLNPGEPYVYQYFIDGEIKVGDPYTEQVSNPWNDRYISEEIYPNLISYPDNDNAVGVASVLQTGQTPYQWDVENFTPPKKEDLVIYEMLIRDFVESHSYATIADTLDYLKRMGVNALELMPVNEFEGNSSWGYNPAYYFAPDKAYGPKEELKKLIDEAHKRGMAVILDIVLNHSYGQSPFVQMYFNNGAPAENNPWYNREHNFENSDAQWGYDFDHESPYTEALVDSINTYWMSEYKVDGFRFDFTKGFSNDIKDEDTDPWGSNYDAERIENLKRMSDAIWSYNSDAIVVMEHLSDNSEETELANYGMMLWGNMNYNYNEAMMGWHEGDNSDFSWASYKERGWNEPNLVTYMESHDEERLIYKTLEYGNQNNPDYNVQDMTIALERAGMTAAFHFAIPGPKMIWQFGELGYDVSINYDCRVCPKPIRWNYYDDYRRKFLYDVYSALAELKTEYEVFETTNFSLDVDDALKKVRLDGDEMDVVIVGNFDVEEGEINPAFYQTGTWYDYFTGNSIEVEDTSEPITLQPGEYHIYTSEQIESANLNVDVEEVENSALGASVYPNPSQNNFNIRLETQKIFEGNISVFNTFGEKVTDIYEGALNPGTHKFNWTPGNKIATGIYFLRITNSEGTIMKKMLYQ